MRYPDKEQKSQIGFLYVINSLELMTAMGTELSQKAEPYGIKNLDKLVTTLNNLELVIEKIIKNTAIKDSIEVSLCKLNDIRKTINRLNKDYVLDEVELFEIKRFAKVVTDVKMAYDQAGIDVNSINLSDLTSLFKLLDPESTGIMTFHIYSRYSKKLERIREDKKSIEKQIFSEVDAEVKSDLLSKRLQFVVAEEAEEKKVKKSLTLEINKYQAQLEESIKSLGELDFFLAKGKLAQKYSCTMPTINNDDTLLLEDAINPMVSDILLKKEKTFTPISITMSRGATLLTGANMGGKSVSIQTIVLNIMLAQSGFFVFAKKAIMPAYNYIYYISDDMQSVEKGLSTYGAEILKLKIVIASTKVTDGFIALDELARGTNPREGRDIVQGIIMFLKTKKSHSLISTHYDGVITNDVRHYQVVGLRDADFTALHYKVELYKGKAVDIIQEHMDYHLQEVKELQVPKDALKIAKLLGLDSEVLEMIEGFYK